MAGPGIKYSINVEYPFYSKNKVTLNGRLGFGILKQTDATFGRPYNFVTVPVGIAGYYGNRNGHLEVAVTASYMRNEPYFDGLTKTLNLFPGIGYRYQRPTGGIFGSIMWTPLIVIKDYGSFPSANAWFNFGISVGYAFPLKR